MNWQRRKTEDESFDYFAAGYIIDWCYRWASSGPREWHVRTPNGKNLPAQPTLAKAKAAAERHYERAAACKDSARITSREKLADS